MQAFQPTDGDSGERLKHYKLLLTRLQAATSNAEQDDVPVMLEVDAMKMWITGELFSAAFRGLTYEAAPAEVHRLVLNITITATHLLRLWANRPAVLQGSSAAARVTTSVVMSYIGFPWEASARAKVRRQALTPGFVSAYTAACEALAAALDKASCADVPDHIVDMAVVLMWTWRAAMQTFDQGEALEDAVMYSTVLPVVRLAGAALRYWAGPAAASESSALAGIGSKAINAAVDVAVMLVDAAVDISRCGKQALRERLSLDYSSITSSHDLQWLLCCYFGLAAQALHKQQKGQQQQPLVTAAGKRQRHHQQQQQQQQQPGKVAAVHKRLLDGLGVPGLIGWQYTGHVAEEHWKTLEAYHAALACAVFNIQTADDRGSGSSSAMLQHQQESRQPPLLTATVHLRRTAVLLELCLLQLQLCPLLVTVQDMRRCSNSMYLCLCPEESSDEAALARADAAVAAGILPTVLQQLLPVLPAVMQQAEDDPESTGDGFRLAVELGMFFSDALAASHCPDHLVRDALLQPSSAQVLESSVRCWAHLLQVNPSSLPGTHQDWMLVHRLAASLTCFIEQLIKAAAGTAAEAAVAPRQKQVLQSPECLALCVSCLKAMVCLFKESTSAARAVAAQGAHAVDDDSSSCPWASIANAFALVVGIADVAITACRSLSSSSSSSSSSRQVQAPGLPAWQLLLAHSLHAVGSMLIGLYADGLLPGAHPPLQQQQSQGAEPSVGANQEVSAVLLPAHPEAVKVLRRLRLVLASVGPQLTALQGSSAAAHSAAAAAAAAGAGGGKVDPLLRLLQQHDVLSESFRQHVAAAVFSGSSGSGSNPQQQPDPDRDEYCRDSIKMLVSLRSTVPAVLGQQLVDFAAALSGRFPAKLACNAPGCSSLARFSELEAVGGKSCMCAKCKTARYCCRSCQESHWKAHKHACRALAAQQQQAR